MADPHPDHLKMIQAVINRMARCSFALKTWSVTVAAALLSLAAAGTDRAYAWIAVGAVTVFAFLDGWYLALERAYRDLYDDTIGAERTTWSLTARRVSGGHVLAAVFSPSVLLLHGAALVAALLVAVSA